MLITLVFDVIVIMWLALLTILLLIRRRSEIAIRKVKFSNLRDLKVKRYIIFSVICNEKVSAKEIEDGIKKSVKELLGEMWLEISNPKIIYYDENKLEGIISTNRAGYKVVIASLPLIKEINGKKVLIYSRKTTGSLKKAKELLGI